MVKMNDGSRGRGGGGGRVGARRGQVHGFSYGSRRRMIDAVSSVDLDQVSGIFFVTLTAPHATWELIEEWRRAWMKRLLRRWGHLRFSVLCRKEPHESGRPHLHCLIYFLDPVPQLVSGFRPWNDHAWAEVTGRPEIAGTCCRVEWLKTKDRAAAFYCSKYCAKIDAGGSGRQWGIIRREHWPMSMQSENVPRGVIRIAQRVLLGIVRRRAERWERFDAEGGRWVRLDSELVESSGFRSLLDDWRKRGGRARRRAPRFIRRVSPEFELIDASAGGDGERQRVHRRGRPAAELLYREEMEERDRVRSFMRPEHVYPGRWFIKQEIFERVLAWAKVRWLEKLELDASCPI